MSVPHTYIKWLVRYNLYHIYNNNDNDMIIIIIAVAVVVVRVHSGSVLPNFFQS